MRVLIVEDDALVADGLRFVLQAEGYDVTGVVDDLSASLHSIASVPADVALVDLKLAHGTDGLDVARALTRAGIPCILTTGNMRRGARAEIALGCLHKPYTVDALLEALAYAEARDRSSFAVTSRDFEPYC